MPDTKQSMGRVVANMILKGMSGTKRRGFERPVEILFVVCALVTILLVGLITVMIFTEGVPIFSSYGFFNFLFGEHWTPTAAVPQYGIWPMIVTSFYVTVLSMIIALPIGLACSVFLAEIAPERPARVLRRAIDVLAGIPSVVFGFFGLTVIVPILRDIFSVNGQSVLAGSIILAIMILPTIISISEVGLRAVPADYKAASLAMGASHWQTIYKVLIPAARNTIFTGVVLAIGRALGETMAVILVMGNTPAMPDSLLDPARTLTVNIVMDMSYVTPGTEHYSALFGTAIVLFVFIMVLNFGVNRLIRKKVL